MRPDQPNTTLLLERAAEGEPAAVDELLPLVYEELRALAINRMGAERPDHTLQPTALVHEVYLRLIDQRAGWKNRAQFFGLASEIIRRVLVDHARSRAALKRGGGRARLTLSDTPGPEQEVDLLALDDALDKLRSLNERQARIVELRFFGGLTTEDAARFLDVNRSTVTDDWSIARAWLAAELRGARA